jgi:nicotinate-nucleotide--dimethylbenzimidazole phosphoribosyltransferase
MAKATVNALQRLRRPEDVARIRGLPVSRVLPWRPEPEPEPVLADAEPVTNGAEPVDTPSPFGAPLEAERIAEDEAVLEPAEAVADSAAETAETPAEAQPAPAQEEPADAEA